MNDKLLHFLILLAATFCIALFSPITAFIVGLIIAVGKELYDKYIKKTFIDVYDLLADYGGIFTALILAQIVVDILK